MFSFFRLFFFILYLIYIITRYSFYLIIKQYDIFFSKSLVKLGPAFVKFAQLLSTRPDIIGSFWAKNLLRTQDKMPYFGISSINKTFKKNFDQLPNEIFKKFDYCPVAAASIAQVHKAQKHNGQYCAVKILRPNITNMIHNNIKLLFVIVNFLDRNFIKLKRLRLPEIINLLEYNLLHEIDLTFEAASALQFKINLQKDQEIYIPEIDWQLTKTEIMVSEWIDATPISKIKQTTLNKRLILVNLINIFCNQVYRDGIFHADMHPGNIFVDNQCRIIPVDFGIVGRLDPKSKLYITEILRGFLQKDYALIAKIHFEAGYVEPQYNIYDFENACRAIGEQIVGKNFSEISVGALFTALLKLTNDFNMKTRIELLLVQKATILLEAVASSIDPQMNIWQLSENWLKNNYMSKTQIIKRKLEYYLKLWFNCIKTRMQD